ncbi:protein RESISTANCE TO PHYTOPHTHORA 1, chloroplastic-like isoform X2 [Malus sylvestris]|uniref:protein RESISTANCE TO PHYTOPHTHORA 1, chloroplastic-like isoform X2 n=1 Tax=Malus domestica TaxID=3750 RepID=UPI000498EAD2|nr:protein RESISTANCE TO PHYTOPHTHORA 1, chloroplastic-like isoform X2 [Malus domestica]XP_050111149.1 protein RESISTANCE TO PHYTOPHTHORA 1, chloroplastic-like isoform X2 [Malus sylvestris]
MNTLTSTTLCNFQVSRYPFTVSNPRNVSPCNSPFPTKIFFRLYANANELDAPAAVEEPKQEPEEAEPPEAGKSSTFSAAASPLDKDLKKVVQKTAATFAPRASTASKNPAVPGSTLYTVFEVQAYASMLLGGVLSFNLIFPSNEPDIWRLMGMWSIWMFTIPSLRARDCSKNEKEALNYLFLLVPLLNVTIPFFVKSFAVVWSADTVAFFAMYAWKLGWLERKD